ncbi:hypothetical protein MRX96_022555 [Rhipicephalus microplus]
MLAQAKAWRARPLAPLEARFAPGAPCPLQQHYARMLMQQQHAVPTSGGTPLFPYLSALSNNASSPGGSPLGPLGKLPGSAYVAKHGRHAPVLAPLPLRPICQLLLATVAMGGSYYSLFPPLSSPPDPFGPPWKLVSSLGTLCFPLPFTSGQRWRISLTKPGLAPVALRFGTVTSCQLFAAVTTHIEFDGHGSEPPRKAPLNSSTQSVRPLSKPPNAHTKDRCSEKSRSKKSSQKSTNKSGPTDLSMVHRGLRTLSDNGGTAATVGVVASSPPTEPSTTVGMSLHCIPSDQVTSTVPSPSAHPPPLLSPTGPAVVSSSTPDVSLTPPTPEAAADSPVSNTPPLHSPPQSSPLRNLSPMPKPTPELSTSSQKDTSVFRGRRLQLNDRTSAVPSLPWLP